MSTPRADATKAALVEAAVTALRGLTAADVISAVGLRAVAERVGVRVTTLYHHFGSLEGFAEAVVQRVFDPGEFGVEPITERVTGALEADLPVDVGRAMHRREFARVRDDPELRARLGLWALGGERVDRAYGDMLRTVDGRIGAALPELFAGWGREISPPFEPQSYVAMHSALLSGAVVRHLVDPGGIEIERFARTAQALTMTSLRVLGDRRTLEDRLLEINYYPTQGRAAVAPRGRRVQTRARLLAAAAELLGRQGTRHTTIAMVARLAGVSPSTAYAAFPDVDALAVALLRTQAGEVVAGHEPAADGGVNALRERLRVVATVLGRRSLYAGPWVTALATGGLDRDDPLVTFVEQGLRTARGIEVGPSDAGVPRAARAVLLALAGEALADDRGAPTTAGADEVLELFLTALGLRTTEPPASGTAA